MSSPTTRSTLRTRRPASPIASWRTTRRSPATATASRRRGAGMAASYPDLLAHGVEDAGRFDQFDLFAGSGPWHTTQMLVEDSQAIEQFAPVALNTDGKVVPWLAGLDPEL